MLSGYHASTHAAMQIDHGSLPDCDCRAVATNANPSGSPGKMPRHCSSILIAEDSILNQKVLRTHLQYLGKQITIANNGSEALDELRKSAHWAGNDTHCARFSLILMDIDMPVMNGITCVRRIRQLERSGKITPAIPVIAISSNTQPGDICVAKTAGVVSLPASLPCGTFSLTTLKNSYLSKPFGMSDLLIKMSELLGSVTDRSAVEAAWCESDSRRAQATT